MNAHGCYRRGGPLSSWVPSPGSTDSFFFEFGGGVLGVLLYATHKTLARIVSPASIMWGTSNRRNAPAPKKTSAACAEHAASVLLAAVRLQRVANWSPGHTLLDHFQRFVLRLRQANISTSLLVRSVDLGRQLHQSPHQHGAIVEKEFNRFSEPHAK